MTTDDVNEDHAAAWLDSSPPQSPQSEGELPLPSGSEHAKSSSSPAHSDSEDSDDLPPLGQAGPQLEAPPHLKRKYSRRTKAYDPRRDPNCDPDGLGIPLDTSGPTGDISPVRGTKEEQKAKRTKISQAKRAQTMAVKREKQAEEVASADAQAEAKAEQARTLTDEVQKELQGLLDSLRKKGITLQHLMNFVFNPKYSQEVVRWDEFLSKEGAVEELLNFLVHTNKMTTDRVYEWAVS
jgi:hypothetical protein